MSFNGRIGTPMGAAYLASSSLPKMILGLLPAPVQARMPHSGAYNKADI